MNKINKHDLLDPVTIFKEVLTGQRKRFPLNYWKHEKALANSAEITRYMIESLLHWTKEDIKEKLCIETFKAYRLRGMVNLLFGEHTWRAIDNAYPGVFLPWELKGSSVGRWNPQLRIDAVKWLVEVRLELPEEHYMYVVARDFENNGLAGLLAYYNGSPKAALMEVYPTIDFEKDKNKNFGIKTSTEIKKMISVIAKYNKCNATEWLEKTVRSEYMRIIKEEGR